MTKGKQIKKKGLLIVFTGDGKGKTTSALGLALRAVGHDFYVYMVQFIKGNIPTGEMNSVQRLAPNFQLIRTGLGFTHGPWAPKGVTQEEHRQAAQEGLRLGREAIISRKYHLVILDEIFPAFTVGLISMEDLQGLISDKPRNLHLVLTGRGAPPEIIEKADLVTEMKEIMHPWRKGILPQRGVEF